MVFFFQSFCTFCSISNGTSCIGKYQSLRETFNIYKETIGEQEDPFVLRLALNQSRKDFAKVASELQNFKEEFAHGTMISEASYNQLYLQMKKIEQDSKDYESAWKNAVKEKEELQRMINIMKNVKKVD